MTRCFVRSLSILKRSVPNVARENEVVGKSTSEDSGETTKRELFVDGVRFRVDCGSELHGRIMRANLYPAAFVQLPNAWGIP